VRSSLTDPGGIVEVVDIHDAAFLFPNVLLYFLASFAASDANRHDEAVTLQTALPPTPTTQTTVRRASLLTSHPE
jgi:hypothetical protein